MAYGRQALWEDDIRWRDVRGGYRRRFRVEADGHEPKIIWAHSPDDAASRYKHIRALADETKVSVSVHD